ncbi:TonB-dependent receptor domain-containing protein [Lacihabitans lacunae]|jgi:ferric enterobactin receptor|uniref:TonB-dependent receptor domain-containing protein n=1 Tax=Lacihabitans lacunae TaxID=1028214 RepID=A0ABV7YY78_9BACT
MKKANYTLIILTLLLSSLGGYAQYGPGGGRGGDGERSRPQNSQATSLDLEGDKPKGNAKIYGNVVDEALTTAVEFANIALIYTKTKKPVDGTMADENGKFEMKKIGDGKYSIQVSFIGYEPLIIPNIVIEKGNDLDLGVIKLKQSTKQLDELVVSGQASMIEEKVDRLVYNAEKDLSAKGGDAADILRNVPMLSVDLEGNVSLRGSENIRVLINNKPSTIVASSIADALKMLPADLIKSVEVITSPSAKYDAEGTAGIINIITKKSTLKGLNLNLDTGAGLRGSNLGLNGNYRTGKLGVTIGGYGRAFYNKSAGTSEQFTFANNLNTVQDNTGKHFGMFGRYNLGFDYDISSKQSLSAGVAFGTRRFDRTQILTSTTFKDDAQFSKSIRDVNSIDNSDSYDINLDYLRTFKPGQEWYVSSQYSLNNLINNFDSDLLSPDNMVLNMQRNINGNTNKEMTLQSDFVSPIGKRQQIEFGGKGVLRQVNSDFNYLKALPSQEYLVDNSRPSGFLNYSQNVFAGYLSYMFTTKNKYTVKSGLRYELTSITAEDRTGNINIPAYNNLVPSINISKKLQKSTVKLAYNRRIQRPGLQQLNPNFNLSNPFDISYGNPSLSPELTNNVEFSVSGAIKKSYLTVAVFARQSNNAINRVSFASDTLAGAIQTTYFNTGKEQTVGTNLFGNIFLNTNWTLNGGVDIYYRYLEGQQAGLDGISKTISNQGFVISGRVMSTYKLKNGWAVQANGGMRGNRVNLLGSQGGMGMYSLGARKEFNKKSSLGLSADNFFGGMTMRSNLLSPQLKQNTTQYMYNSNVRVTFSYKIGNMKFVEKKKTKGVSNDDVMSSGGDTGN